jgi:hypothetical protein
MNLDRLIQWVDAGAWRGEQLERTVSGAGEEAEILRQIQAHLVSLKLQPMETAPRDGKEILLLTNIGAVSAHYDKGMGWCETPDGREYFGPAWVCYDAAFELEIEETPIGELCPAALGWLPIPLATS